jgi:hypothetical protein
VSETRCARRETTYLTQQALVKLTLTQALPSGQCGSDAIDVVGVRRVPAFGPEQISQRETQSVARSLSSLRNARLEIAWALRGDHT